MSKRVEINNAYIENTFEKLEQAIGLKENRVRYRSNIKNLFTQSNNNEQINPWALQAIGQNLSDNLQLQVIVEAVNEEMEQLLSNPQLTLSQINEYRQCYNKKLTELLKRKEYNSLSEEKKEIIEQLKVWKSELIINTKAESFESGNRFVSEEFSQQLVEQLFGQLNDKKFIDCNLQTFAKYFSLPNKKLSRVSGKKIDWKKSIGELRLFVLTLSSEFKILLSEDKDKWEIADSCFLIKGNSPNLIKEKANGKYGTEKKKSDIKLLIKEAKNVPAPSTRNKTIK